MGVNAAAEELDGTLYGTVSRYSLVTMKVSVAESRKVRDESYYN